MHRVRPSFSVPVVAILAAAGLLSGCEKPTPATPAVADVAPPSAATGSAQAPAAPANAAPAVPTGSLEEVVIGSELLPSQADAAKGPSCNLENIAGKDTGTDTNISAKAGTSATMTGWLFSFASHSVPANRYVRIQTEDGSHAWQTLVGGASDRADILPWFGVGDWALKAGFHQAVQLGTLAPGKYHVLLTFSENGKMFACDNGRTLTITP
jgi:hypothetical protein